MLMRGHIGLSDDHMCIHKWNEPYLSLLSVTDHYRIPADTHFLFHLGYEAELALVAGYIPRWFSRSKMVTHSQY